MGYFSRKLEAFIIRGWLEDLDPVTACTRSLLLLVGQVNVLNRGDPHIIVPLLYFGCLSKLPWVVLLVDVDVFYRDCLFASEIDHDRGGCLLQCKHGVCFGFILDAQPFLLVELFTQLLVRVLTVRVPVLHRGCGVLRRLRLQRDARHLGLVFGMVMLPRL